MSTVYVRDVKSRIARRRLFLITLSLFVAIMIITTLTFYLHDNKLNSQFNDEGSSLKNEGPYKTHSTVFQYATTKGHFTDETLTRYGANLKFNSRHRCPEGSLMMSAKANSYRHGKGKTNKCPKVFIIGAKKGGTTSLYQYLSMHPDFRGIGINNTKWVGETFYFAQRYGKVSLNSYLNLFPKRKMSGDASVDNLLHCKAPFRILKTCGGRNTKVIILLRHPIQRYVSNFMMRMVGRTYKLHSNSSSIHDQLLHDIKLLNRHLGANDRVYPHHASEWNKLLCLFECCQDILYEGLYYVFVMNWLCNFPKENILFINSEEMFWRPALILKQVLDFVGLKPLSTESLYEITSHVYNKGVKPFLPQHHMSSDDQELLLSYYSIFNDAIFDLLDWRLNWS